MPQFGVTMDDRTIGRFIELYNSVQGNTTLGVPRENQLLAFLDIIRQCKINSDNLLAGVSDDGFEIRMNKKILRQVPDQQLKHLLAFDYFDRIDLDSEELDWPIYEEDLKKISPTDTEQVINAVVFGVNLSWPSKSEES